MHEEDCALRFAAMAPVEGAHYNGPSEGKVTLIADRRGMFRADTALQKQLNSIWRNTQWTNINYFNNTWLFIH